MANVTKSEINHQNCIYTWQRRLGLATGIHIDEFSVTFDEKESNDGMKVVQEMTNSNNTEKETQPTIDEDSEVEIQVSTQDVDNQVIGDGNCNDDMNVPLRRSTRNNKDIPPVKLSLMVKNELMKEPSSWNEMKLLPEEEQKQWIRAADEEMGSHNKNQTWILCDLPAGKKAIDWKWVFKLKQNADGNVYRHKAILVARGFTQKFGEDFDDTFAPVARHTTLRTLLTVAASKKMQVNHYDVKISFLNGDIKEELYMNQPEGFAKPDEEQKVCKLKKALGPIRTKATSKKLESENRLCPEIRWI